MNENPGGKPDRYDFSRLSDVAYRDVFFQLPSQKRKKLEKMTKPVVYVMDSVLTTFRRRMVLNGFSVHSVKCGII
jgi:hypothetical protein